MISFFLFFTLATALLDPLECTDSSKSGYLYPRKSANPADGSGIFYWMFPSRSNPADDPTVIWMQGGPGASSLLGAFYEQGPCLMQPDGTLAPNQFGWNRAANLIYIDQPVGTGFSFAANGTQSMVGDMSEMAHDMVQTILLLLQRFPQLQKNPLVLAGESYAGRYIPFLATAITAHNEGLRTKNKLSNLIPLTTLFINDPWTNPAKIVSTYANFSLAHGIISPADVQALNANMSLFNEAMAEQRYDDATDIEHAMEHYIEAVSGVSAYDIRKYTSDDYSGLDRLLSSESARERLGVGNHTWQLSNDAVNAKLHADISQPTSGSGMVGKLLDTYRVVIYNGNYDLDCNIWGTLKWLLDVKWSGAQAFAEASKQRRKWILPNPNPNLGNNSGGSDPPAGHYVAGYCVEVGKFTQLVMLNAGHMVPGDQHSAALELLTQTLASPSGDNPACSAVEF